MINNIKFKFVCYNKSEIQIVNLWVIKVKKKENTYNFDLSNLSLKELIEVYENITNFLDYLENHKIEIETKEEK